MALSSVSRFVCPPSSSGIPGSGVPGVGLGISGSSSDSGLEVPFPFWIPGSGRVPVTPNHLPADVKMVYTKKKYEFQCNNYQLSVLLLFNEGDKWYEGGARGEKGEVEER
jgi:hypothetical protein